MYPKSPPIEWQKFYSNCTPRRCYCCCCWGTEFESRGFRCSEKWWSCRGGQCNAAQYTAQPGLVQHATCWPQFISAAIIVFLQIYLQVPGCVSSSVRRPPSWRHCVPRSRPESIYYYNFPYVFLVRSARCTFFRRFLGKLRLEIAVIICSLLNMKISFWSTICVAYHHTALRHSTLLQLGKGETNLLTCAKLVAYSRLDIAIWFLWPFALAGLSDVRCSLFTVHCLYQPCIYEIHPSVNSRILCQLQQSLWVFIKFYDPEIVALISRQFMLHLSVLAKRNELRFVAKFIKIKDTKTRKAIWLMKISWNMQSMRLGCLDCLWLVAIIKRTSTSWVRFNVLSPLGDLGGPKMRRTRDPRAHWKYL